MIEFANNPDTNASPPEGVAVDYHAVIIELDSDRVTQLLSANILSFLQNAEK
jgi:hypothetical protein